ncbi:hypothetical protein J6590_090412 [Homalodisca vitripennis]|nr:hypothetical protein J6590_090412 [Homalodisca vitripennis]
MNWKPTITTGYFGFMTLNVVNKEVAVHTGSCHLKRYMMSTEVNREYILVSRGEHRSASHPTVKTDRRITSLLYTPSNITKISLGERITGFWTFAIVTDYERYNNVSKIGIYPLRHEGGINTYRNKEQKEVNKGKKRVLTYLKAAWSPVQVLSLNRIHKYRARHKYEITIAHHTVTKYTLLM